MRHPVCGAYRFRAKISDRDLKAYLARRAGASSDSKQNIILWQKNGVFDSKNQLNYEDKNKECMQNTYIPRLFAVMPKCDSPFAYSP